MSQTLQFVHLILQKTNVATLLEGSKKTVHYCNHQETRFALIYFYAPFIITLHIPDAGIVPHLHTVKEPHISKGGWGVVTLLQLPAPTIKT